MDSGLSVRVWAPCPVEGIYLNTVTGSDRLLYKVYILETDRLEYYTTDWAYVRSD